VQEVFADLLDTARDAVAVERPEGFEGPQYQEDESSLEHFGFCGGVVACFGHLQEYSGTPFGNQQKKDRWDVRNYWRGRRVVF
jgi:hypothetical protein